MLLEQSKTDPFHCGHTITTYATGTSTCPLRALKLYTEASTPSQANSPVFKGGRFFPLDRQHLAITVHHLLQNTQYNQQHYTSHSFRSGAATTAAAAPIPDWLIKFLGTWRSNVYQGYIRSSLAMLQSVPALLAHTNTPDMGISTTQ